MRKYWEDDKKVNEIKSKQKPDADKNQNKDVKINPKSNHEKGYKADDYYGLLALYISDLPEEDIEELKEEFKSGNAQIILKKVK